MRDFVDLINNLDQTTKTLNKVSALKHYFEIAEDKDKVWTIFLLSGQRLKRSVNSRLIKQWAIELSNLPEWLFEETYTTVGDMSETISLILPENKGKTEKTLSEWMNYINDLKSLSEAEKKEKIIEAWSNLTQQECFIFNKIAFGSFRIGVSQSLVVRALSKITSKETTEIQYALTGEWNPFEVTFDELLSGDKTETSFSKPYPFFLSSQLEGKPEELGDPNEWTIEWKWDGIRSQIINREGKISIWTRGEELVTDKFPELIKSIESLPEGTVMDGEILPFVEHPLSFNVLQTRIGRKNVTEKILSDAPVIFYAYDLIELEGEDLRNKPLEQRQKLMRETVNKLNSELDESRILLPPKVEFNQWSDLDSLKQTSRENYSEGLMLKRKSSEYQVGRKRGDWWKWKVDPYTTDAVMIYAQRGHGRRANLYTDYTFAVWSSEENRGKSMELIPFAKAYSGLTDEEINKVNKYVLDNTIEKFGPVRSVKAGLVFEIAFEGIQESPRHKSGIAVRFPRILRIRHDKKPEDANTIEDLKILLKSV